MVWFYEKRPEPMLRLMFTLGSSGDVTFAAPQKQTARVGEHGRLGGALQGGKNQ
jgi:hypothetical protein